MILSGVNESVLLTLTKSGLADEIGKENIFPHIQLAIEKASEIVRRSNEISAKKHQV